MTWDVRIEADSLNTLTGDRVTTFVMTYPRIPCHEDMLTHRMLSRNARSNRAVGTAKLLETGLYVPENDFWRADESRMRQNRPLSETQRFSAAIQWRDAARQGATQAGLLADMGVHRQIANRPYQPYQFITAVFTATDWWHFFRLRAHEKAEAEPPVLRLARWMLDEYRHSTPRRLQPREWHLPFIKPEDREWGNANWPADQVDTILAKLSTGRSCRVSNLTFEGETDQPADVALHDRLLVNGHMSPFEHACFASLYGDYHANFKGFVQYRRTLPRDVEYNNRPFD